MTNLYICKHNNIDKTNFFQIKTIYLALVVLLLYTRKVMKTGVETRYMYSCDRYGWLSGSFGTSNLLNISFITKYFTIATD